jgi:hypothetical protein
LQTKLVEHNNSTFILVDEFLKLLKHFGDDTKSGGENNMTGILLEAFNHSRSIVDRARGLQIFIVVESFWWCNFFSYFSRISPFLITSDKVRSRGGGAGRRPDSQSRDAAACWSVPPTGIRGVCDEEKHRKRSGCPILGVGNVSLFLRFMISYSDCKLYQNFRSYAKTIPMNLKAFTVGMEFYAETEARMGALFTLFL